MVRIVFHSADLDGHSSGAIARWYCEYINGVAYTMHGYNYGQTLDTSEWLEGDTVIFLDCAVQPVEVMKEIMSKWETVIIDHHISTVELMDLAKGGSHSIDKAACELAWEYFFPQERIPQFISLLGRYDIWDKSDPNKWKRRIIPFHYGMELYRTHPAFDDGFELWNNMIGKAIDHHFRDLDEWIDDTMYKGKIAQKAIEGVYRSAASSVCHEVEFEGMKAIVANTFIKNSQFFESKYDPSIHDVMIAWSWNGKYDEYGFGMYTTKDLDLSIIAKKYGGGGHKQAAGFGCKHISFSENKMIVRKDSVE